MKRNIFWTFNALFFVLCFFNMLTVTAHAYIDPSAVTYIIQAVAGVAIALGAALTIFRHKIASFFRKNKSEGEKRTIHLKDEENASDN